MNLLTSILLDKTQGVLIALFFADENIASTTGAPFTKMV